MALVTIFGRTYSKGKEIAEKLVEKLGYRCLSRENILEASEYFNIPEIRLERTLNDYKKVNDELAGLTNIKDIQLEMNPVLIPD